MTPAVRFFWIVSLAWLPLSYYLLMDATEWNVMPAALGEYPVRLTLFLFAVVYVCIGMRDLYSSESNLRRNYPVVANLRYLLESIRPEIRQYFIASNLEEAPFNCVSLHQGCHRARPQIPRTVRWTAMQSALQRIAA